MTRILHVLDHSLPLHSGYTFRTRAILKAQEAIGLEVRAVTGLRQQGEFGDIGPEHHAGLTFYRTPGAARGPAGLREWNEVAMLAEAIARACEEWRPDVIHAHSPALCGLAAVRAADALGVPLVYEIRAFWEDAAVGNGTGRETSLRYWLTRRLENRVVDRASKVVTICSGLKDDLVARGHPPGKFAIVPNGVDLDLFGAPLERDEALARELGFAAGPVIGFIGSFYPYEGIDDLIAAMPGIVQVHPRARLLLVGGGPEERRLRAMAQASETADAIRFVGRVPHEEVDRYYSLVDVVAYPRKAMRLTDLVTPLKPLEAMAQGKIVAASNVGGHRELVDDGITGALFAPGNPAELARSLCHLLARRSDWNSLRTAARRHVEREHDWLTNVQRYRDVYHHLLIARPSDNVAA